MLSKTPTLFEIQLGQNLYRRYKIISESDANWRTPSAFFELAMIVKFPLHPEAIKAQAESLKISGDATLWQQIIESLD